MSKKLLIIFSISFFLSCIIACNEEKSNLETSSSQDEKTTIENADSHNINSLDENVQQSANLNKDVQHHFQNPNNKIIRDNNHPDEINQNKPDTNNSPIKVDTDKKPLSQLGVIGCRNSNEIPYTILSEGIIALHENPLESDNTGFFVLTKDDAEAAQLKDVDFDNYSIWYIYYGVKHCCPTTF